MVPKDLPKPSELDWLGSAGVSPAVFGVPPNTRRTPAVHPLGETPSGATGTVALPEITHFQSHPRRANIDWLPVPRRLAPPYL